MYRIVDCSNPRKRKVVHFNRLKPAPVGPESRDNEDGQAQQHVSTEMPKTSSKRPPELQDEEDEGEYIYSDTEGPNTDAAPEFLISHTCTFQRKRYISIVEIL